MWHKRYKAMKKALGYTNASIAEITGNTIDSVKSTTQPHHKIPRWLKLAIVVFERNNNKQVLPIENLLEASFNAGREKTSTEEKRMIFQLELLNDIIDHRLTIKQLRARRDYFKNELSKQNNPKHYE